jgi:hypothetical protein
VTVNCIRNINTGVFIIIDPNPMDQKYGHKERGRTIFKEVYRQEAERKDRVKSLCAY